jgi:hypothetical protein
MTPDERRKPETGALENHFPAELETLAIPTISYNLPDWESNPQSVLSRLVSLLSHNPPPMLFDVPV